MDSEVWRVAIGFMILPSSQTHQAHIVALLAAAYKSPHVVEDPPPKQTHAVDVAGQLGHQTIGRIKFIVCVHGLGDAVGVKVSESLGCKGMTHCS